ncbi:PKD domain-containing protein [Paenibacillus thalictri]|uniref:PKD domain-containing protein n=1 Tax=Paenibacillus thalictri TaxID=2527873 RepID=A0A4Q9DPN3_9BACL|nr:PKD domain-containing protein [Paenibacillus thalictri]TBL78250.1 PKD domain-containing protein [Paenibacillus thalictri]
MKRKKWNRPASLGLMVCLALAAPQIASAYDYTSYSGLHIIDPKLIPPESKTSDEDKKMDGLIRKLQDKKLKLAALPAQEVHPSLWFTDKELPDYQARRLMKGSYYEQLWAKMEADVNNTYLGYDYADPQLHENDRSRGAKLLAFYYMMIKDDTAVSVDIKKQALDQAKAALIHMYTGTVEERTKDDGDIYWATYLQDYASAYDWLFNDLSLQERQEARARLKKEAQFIADWLMTPQPPRPHNHRSKPALGLGTVALTLADEPEAQYWLNIAIERTYNVFDFQFSSDGISREGAHYGQFTLVNLIPFLWNYKHVTGDQAPADIAPDTLIRNMQPVFEWAVKTRMGNGWLPNTEESYVKPYATHMAAGLYKNTDAPQYGQGLKLSEVLQWSYANTQVYLPDYTGATSQYQIGIDEYLTYDATIAAKPPTVSRTTFMNGGVNPKTGQPFGGNAVLGNQWSSPMEPQGDKTLWLMFNGTPESDNHQHQDQLHFNIWGKNALFATDTGYGQYSAFNSWLKTPQAHNLITMNGRSTRNETDPYMPVRSAYEIDTDRFDFAQKEGDFYADDRSVMGTHKRAVAFPGQQYFVVADQTSSRIGAADWTMNLHSLGELHAEGAHARWAITKQATPELTEKPKPGTENTIPYYGLAEAKMEAYIFPSSQKVEAKSGIVSLFKEDINESYIQAAQNADKIQYLTVLVPQGLNEKAPAVQDLSTAEVTAARVGMEDSQDTYLLQMNSGQSATAGHLTTDGTFAWIREQSGVPSGMMMREGRQLWINGVKRLEANVPVTAVLALNEKEWLLTVSDAPQDATATVNLPVGIQAESVTVNGEKVAGARVDGQTVSLPLKSETYRIAVSGKSSPDSAGAPSAEFTVDHASEYGERGTGARTVKFDAFSSKGNNLKYEWSFGDGTFSSQSAPVKQFNRFGTFLVNLKVTDDKGRTDTKTALIENKDPNQAPVAMLKADSAGGRPPLKITFDAGESYDPDRKLGDRIASYSWNFGDGTPEVAGEDQSRVEHTFEKVGSFTVTLTVTDTLGLQHKTSTIVQSGSPYGYFNVDLKNADDENVYVLFEAEDITYNSSQDGEIAIVDKPDVSGGKYVKVGLNVPDVTSAKVLDPAYKDVLPPDKIPNGTAYVEYEFKVKHADSYQVHLFSTGSSASNGSVFIQFDNSDLKRVTLKDADWKRAFDNTQFALNEGTHVLRVYSRKGGADWDRVLLTTDGTTHTKVQSTIIPKIEQDYPVAPPQ